MCMQAPVSCDKHNSFPLCMYRCFGGKQLEKSQKGCWSPFHNIWQDWTSPLVFCLQWRVISAAFMHYQLGRMRDLERLLQNRAHQLKFHHQILLLNLSGEVKQSLAWSRFVLASGLEWRALVPMTTAVLVPTVLQEGPPAFMGAEASHAHYNAFQHGNSG